MGNTIIIIEHNLSFVAEVADYMVDLGVDSGDKGGKIISVGNPKDVCYSSGASWSIIGKV